MKDNTKQLVNASSQIKEITMFAKDLSLREIGKTALFWNLCILPSLLAVGWIIGGN